MIVAKIDVQAADMVADFLDRTANENTNAAPWAVARAKIMREVADALHALANDTDVIGTDDEVLDICAAVIL